MVLHGLGFFSVSCIFVLSLRDTLETYTDQAAQDTVASSTVQSIADATQQILQPVPQGNAASRDELLQDVSSIVEGVRSSSSNASTILNKSEKDMLNQVITIVKTDIFEAMDEEQVDDVKDMKEGIRRATDCNTDMNDRIHRAGGDVKVLFQSMNSSKNNHMSCRKLESGKYAVNNTKWKAFEDYKRNELEEPPTTNYVSDPSFSWLNEFFANEEWVVWFNKTQKRYLDLRAQRDKANAELDAMRKACNANQTEYEEFSCNYKYAKTAACRAYFTCYNRSRKFHGETVARANMSEKSRKNAYRVGNIIIDHLKCMLGDSCNTTVVNYSRYEFVPEPMPSSEACTVVDAYPCSANFLNNAYTNMPTGTKHAPCSPCNDTAFQLSNEAPKDCSNSDGPGQEDKHKNKCKDYGKLWCGKYDVKGKFNASEMCCICGGGKYQKDMYSQKITGINPPVKEGVKAGVYDVYYAKQPKVTDPLGSLRKEKDKDNVTIACDGTMYLYHDCAQKSCGEVYNTKIVTDATLFRDCKDPKLVTVGYQQIYGPKADFVLQDVWKNLGKYRECYYLDEKLTAEHGGPVLVSDIYTQVVRAGASVPYVNLERRVLKYRQSKNDWGKTTVCRKEQASKCEDSPNFANGHLTCSTDDQAKGCIKNRGWSCEGYVNHGWCAGGKAVPGMEWTLGKKYNEPEKHCCACGRR